MRAPTKSRVALQLLAVFLAYFVAGKLGQATTSIRSSNLGPVWPAYGIALASFLACGLRIWPAVAASAFLVAVQGAVSPLAAMGQAAGATLGSLTGALLLLRIVNFDPSLGRLRDALGLIVIGALGSALISASIGISALYATGIQPYSGIVSAWLIYWLGDSTGVLLMTPLVFTVASLFAGSAQHRAELAALVAMLTGGCFVVFGDLSVIPIHLHVLAFAVLPLVMWGAIRFGIGGASMSVFLIATFATILTALGHGPFAANTPFVNAALLDVLFGVLAVTGLTLAAVIAERERAEREREQLIREQMAMEARLHLATIVESSDDAIVSTDLTGTIVSWNAAACRIFGFTEAETIGQPMTLLSPSSFGHQERAIRDRVTAGERIIQFEATRITKSGRPLDVSVTVSPLTDASGAIVGAAEIARDVTEQKRAKQALSSINRRLIEAQEQERARIARELHDDIGQRLALLTAQLSALVPAAPEPAAAAQQQASEIAADIQALSHELHTSRLELLGLATGVQLFCREFGERQKASVDFQTRDLPSRLPSNLSLGLFRVVQEGLHNAAKHSGEDRFEVRLWGSTDAIHLTVADQGVGFDLASSKAGRGIGLVTMEERIKLLDGEIVIESQPKRGTTIRARVPFDGNGAGTFVAYS